MCSHPGPHYLRGGGRLMVVGQAIQISILAGEQHLIPSPRIHSWFMCAATSTPSPFLLLLKMNVLIIQIKFLTSEVKMTVQGCRLVMVSVEMKNACEIFTNSKLSYHQFKGAEKK